MARAPDFPPAGGAGAVLELAASGPIDLESVVFAVMSARLQGIDSDIASKLEDMQKRLAVKQAYQARIDELRRLIAGKKDDAEVALGEVDPHRYDYYYDEGADEVRQMLPDGEFDGGDDCFVQVDTVNKEIERLQSNLDSLNSDSEIAMMRLNQDLSRRQQTMTLFSNMTANMHQSAMSVINNIK